jgi:hypothetical protein
MLHLNQTIVVAATAIVSMLLRFPLICDQQIAEGMNAAATQLDSRFPATTANFMNNP